MLSDVKQRVDDLASREKVFLDEIDPKGESKLLDFYVRITPRVLNAERCSVFIHESANGKVWMKKGTGVAERGIEVSMKDSIVGDVIASGKPVIASDLQSRDGTHKKIDAETGFVTREIMCVPVRSRDRSKVTGAIEVLNKKSGGGFDQQDQALLEEIGEHLQSIVDSVFLSQEAVAINKRLVKIASNTVIASVIALTACVPVLLWALPSGLSLTWFLAVGASVSVLVWIYAALASRLR